jgi:hypothetical protein
MKIVISVGLAFALMLAVVPVMAGETETFQAFSTMAAGEQARLTALSDEQLAAIEGQRSPGSNGTNGSDSCLICLQSGTNFSDLRQLNINNSSGVNYRVEQENFARVRQSIRQRIN